MQKSWNWIVAPCCAVCCAVLLLPLVGCPSQSATHTASAPAQATAPAIAVPAPTPPAPAAPAQPTVAQQRIKQLIDQVEAAYALGEADYRKGQLADAKSQFDRAVDMMLESGLDIKGNQQLDDEFDRIVDQVNGLEMEALKQGNGFVPKEELTPAEAASDVTFAVDPNLVAKAQADLATTKSDLPLVANDYVAAFINFFANTQRGHNTLLHSFQRSGLYRGMIQRVLAEEGVPQDLIYLAVAESGFNPRAVGPRTRSGGRAGGMWQFMPSNVYGLERNSYVDERFDPEKSTRAYARYMKFLYGQLGDWYLAMAAYDHGAGNIQHEVAKTGYADFWELYKRHELPGETQNYVPEILAAIIIANHPTQYGFDDISLDPPVLTDTVTVNSSIDLRLVSDLVGAPVDEIEALNPSLLHRVTPPDTAFDLHLPAGTADLFNDRIALIPEDKRNAWRYHTVAAGDTLETVAQTYRVTKLALEAANDLRTGDTIAGMDALVVPTPPEAISLSRTRLYTVRRGDTLVTIADRFGVSLSQLRRWNNIAGVRVEPGRRLHVAEPVTTARTSRARRTASGMAAHSTTAAAKTPGSTVHRTASAGSKAHPRSVKTAPKANSAAQHKTVAVAKPAPQQ